MEFLSIDRILLFRRFALLIRGLHEWSSQGESLCPGGRCAVFASVSSEIPLTIAVDIQPADCDPALHWLLPDCGVDLFASPGHVTGKPDVNGYKPSHQKSNSR